MFEVKTDRSKHRLYVTLDGYMDEAEVKKMTEQVEQAVQQLQAEFTVITDLSDFLPTSTEASEYIKHTQKVIAQHGVKKVVRVVSNIVGAMQFKRTQREAGATYDVVQATSLREAEAILDGKVKE